MQRGLREKGGRLSSEQAGHKRRAECQGEEEGSPHEEMGKLQGQVGKGGCPREEIGQVTMTGGGGDSHEGT